MRAGVLAGAGCMHPLPHPHMADMLRLSCTAASPCCRPCKVQATSCSLAVAPARGEGCIICWLRPGATLVLTPDHAAAPTCSYDLSRTLHPTSQSLNPLW